jgi:hypothetical protein
LLRQLRLRFAADAANLSRTVGKSARTAARNCKILNSKQSPAHRPEIVV